MLTRSDPAKVKPQAPRHRRNPRRERRLWHDPEVASAALGCATCPEKEICGGLRLNTPFMDCLQFCCGNPEGCDRVCRNHPDFADRYREIGGFNLYSVPRAPLLNAVGLPRLVPVIYHPTARSMPPTAATVALPLYRMFDRRTGLPRFVSRDALGEAFGIGHQASVMLTGTDIDRPLERWWGLGEAGRRPIIQALIAAGVGMVTTPNYSLFIDRPRWDDLHAMKRIAIVHEEFLREGLAELKGSGYPQVMVFTQFTDTMDYLRDLLVGAGNSVMCFSGRGGEVRNTDGTWRLITRDDVKRRFKEGRSEVLVCTDAAAEGLNFQFCGALVNYDMPWNPMRVEQRIGRIDRLGQRFSDIRIINLHYEDTVEADVYRALRSRISIFEKVVGGLQPILTRLPRLIEESVLSTSNAPDAKRNDALQALENAISAGDDSALNLDEFADEDLEVPVRLDPAITLSNLRAVLDRPILLPLGTEAVHLDEKDYRLVDGFLPHAVRITVDREFYEMHADSVEFWTPGSPTFPDLDIYRR